APDSLWACSAGSILARFAFLAPGDAADAAKATAPGSSGAGARGKDSVVMPDLSTPDAGRGCGRPMYQGVSSGSVRLWPCRVVDSTSATWGQSSPVCWV